MIKEPWLGMGGMARTFTAAGSGGGGIGEQICDQDGFLLRQGGYFTTVDAVCKYRWCEQEILAFLGCVVNVEYPAGF